MKKDSYFEELESKGYYDTIDKRSKDYREYKQWKVSKINVDYEELKANIEDNNNSKVGLGDVVEKIAEVTGVGKLVKAVTDDCGCDERKEKFNNIRLWNKRKVNCISEEDYIWVKDYLKSKSSKYTYEQRVRFTEIHNNIFNTKHKVSNCTPCINGYVRNIESYLKIWDN